jgi:hypothetical protein
VTCRDDTRRVGLWRSGTFGLKCPRARRGQALDAAPPAGPQQRSVRTALCMFLDRWKWQETPEASLSRRRMQREAAVEMASPARPGGSAAHRERGMEESLAFTGVCCLNMIGTLIGITNSCPKRPSGCWGEERCLIKHSTTPAGIPREKLPSSVFSVQRVEPLLAADGKEGSPTLRAQGRYFPMGGNN